MCTGEQVYYVCTGGGVPTLYAVRYMYGGWSTLYSMYVQVNKYTMWIREVEGVTIPVHYEMRGYNSLLGSHYDHYFLTYENFSDEVRFNKQKRCFGSCTLCCVLGVIIFFYESGATYLYDTPLERY